MKQQIALVTNLIKNSAAKPRDEYNRLITTYLCSISESSRSYVATVDEQQQLLTMQAWSVSAMLNCKMIDKPIVYQLPETGLWGDAVRERQAVITNDYQNLVKPTKKGYPKGHVSVRRHLNLPIFEGTRIVLVVGVGNKPTDYTPEDVTSIETFMREGEVWPTLKRKL